MSRVFQYECIECGTQEAWSKGDLKYACEEGCGDPPMIDCKYCEGTVCHECVDKHECFKEYYNGG